EVLVDEFALRWLHVADLDAVQPDKLLFPEFTDALRRDFAEEIRLFLASVLLEDRDVRTLLTADYTFLNERLARHYGVPAIVGPQLRRVQLTDERRFGLLGKGAVLLRTSYGDRTSPVRRGQFVQALTQKLMMYALGRELEYYDMPQVRAIVRDAGSQRYRFSALVAGIVRSDSFRMQAVAHDDDGGTRASAATTDSSR